MINKKLNMNLTFNNYITEYIKKTRDIEYKHNGAFKSEIFILYALHKLFNCNLFIESGLDNGVSTETLLSLIDCEYLGIDLNENCFASKIDKLNFKFYSGDSTKIIQDHILNNQDSKISIFIDGPKNLQAIELKNKLLKIGRAHV